MLSRLLLVLSLAFTAPGAITLFDDTLGNTPGSQPWLFFGQDSFLSGGTFTQTAIAGVGVQLVTDNAVSAGYSNYLPIVNTLKNPAFPALDRVLGFTLSFQLQLNAESHVSNNRAGFSVILLGSDRQGIELGFWADEIWAQSSVPLFTHAEGVAFNTTAAEVNYTLSILGSTYTLRANGNQILTGSTRDYTAFGSAPYTLGNFVFLGDNTSSAGANATLGLVTLDAVPEPSTLALSALALAALVCRRRA